MRVRPAPPGPSYNSLNFRELFVFIQSHFCKETRNFTLQLFVIRLVSDVVLNVVITYTDVVIY